MNLHLTPCKPFPYTSYLAVLDQTNFLVNTLWGNHFQIVAQKCEI